MNKLSLISSVLYDHTILDQGKQLYTYRLQTIDMSNTQINIVRTTLLKHIKTVTNEYIVHTEFLYSILQADTNYKNEHIFNSEYYNCLLELCTTYISAKTIHSELIKTCVTILFQSLRTSTISFVYIWHMIQTRDSFYNILEAYLNHTIDIQMDAIIQQYMRIID